VKTGSTDSDLNTPAENKAGGKSLRRFVLTFLACLLGLGLLYAFLTIRLGPSINPLLEFTATVSGAIASLFAGAVTWSGRDVICDGFPVTIISECTGLLEMVIFTSAVVAYPSSLRSKLIGFLSGNVAIYVLNIVRIVVLVLVGAHSRRVFDFLHLYFWQATLVIMIAAVWVAWLYLVVFREEERPAAVSA